MINVVENSDHGRAPAEGLTPCAKSSPSVLYLTPEQSQSPLVEVRSSSGKVCCYLFNEATLLLTPAEFSDIKLRASVGKSGQPLHEILKEVRAGVGA